MIGGSTSALSKDREEVDVAHETIFGYLGFGIFHA